MGNRLSTIYTKTGDDGSTGLGNGERIDKASIRINVMGDIDELNSLCGMFAAVENHDEIQVPVLDCLLNIQQRLFDIGGEIARPGRCVIDSTHVETLEELIDTYNEQLPALREFILPGGSMSASICHLARSVCRRAERNFVKMSRVEQEQINPESLRYLNRLSDLLFVLARVLNQQKGNRELFWESARLKGAV